MTQTAPLKMSEKEWIKAKFGPKKSYMLRCVKSWGANLLYFEFCGRERLMAWLLPGGRKLTRADRSSVSEGSDPYLSKICKIRLNKKDTCDILRMIQLC